MSSRSIDNKLRLNIDQKYLNRLCAVSGLISFVLFFLPFATSGWLPPMRPTLTADEVVQHYYKHEAGIKAGAALIAISSLFYAFYTAAISAQMQRIPGVDNLLISIQLCAGAVACVTFLLPGLLFGVTVFRLERPPEITQALNDMGWICLLAPWEPFLPQSVTFAYAIFLDDRLDPLFPYWVGWINILSTVLLMPATGVHAIKTGPIAWNGALTFWVAGAAFLIQCVINTVYLWKALDRNVLKETEDAQPLAVA